MGVDFRTHIDSMVSRCDILIAVIGRGWVDATSDDGRRRLKDPRDLVRLEIEVALSRDIPVIPVLVDGAGMPEEDDLPEALRALAFRNAAPVRSDPDFAGDMKRLIAGLEAHLGGSG